MGILQNLIHRTSWPLPLLHQASHGLEKERSGEFLVNVWITASLLVPLERQICQVGAVNIAGQNRKQSQQAVLWENWHPHVPLRLLSPCLSQWMTVPVSTKVALHPFTKVLNSPTNYYYKLNKYKEYRRQSVFLQLCIAIKILLMHLFA